MNAIETWVRAKLTAARVARAGRLRPVFAGMIDRLPPLAGRTAEAVTDACSAHMLCGAQTFDMGVWASYSLLRHLPELPLYVHSDGTLTDDQQRRWAGVLPGTTFVSMADMDARVAAEWAGRLDGLAAWRRGRPLFTKLTDCHLVSACRRVLLFDSDVLCFRDPEALRRACRDGGRAVAWNDDMYEAYAWKSAAVGELAGCSVPSTFNSGCVALPRLSDDDLLWVQDLLARLVAAGANPAHHWMEQTLLGAVAGHLGGGPLPAAYSVQWSKVAKGKVLRHYVSARFVRERFFTEGLPMVARSLGLRPRFRPS